MTGEPDNMVLILLRRLDEKMDRVIDEIRDLKVRTTAVEENLAGVQRRIDRLEARVERIEKRLDLVDHP
jgi:archaellum component FlaC